MLEVTGFALRNSDLLNWSLILDFLGFLVKAPLHAHFREWLYFWKHLLTWVKYVFQKISARTTHEVSQAIKKENKAQQQRHMEHQHQIEKSKSTKSFWELLFQSFPRMKASLLTFLEPHLPHQSLQKKTWPLTHNLGCWSCWHFSPGWLVGLHQRATREVIFKSYLGFADETVGLHLKNPMYSVTTHGDAGTTNQYFCEFMTCLLSIQGRCVQHYRILLKQTIKPINLYQHDFGTGHIQPKQEENGE